MATGLREPSMGSRGQEAKRRAVEAEDFAEAARLKKRLRALEEELRQRAETLGLPPGDVHVFAYLDDLVVLAPPLLLSAPLSLCCSSPPRFAAVILDNLY